MELYQTALLYLLIFWLKIHNTWFRVRSKSKQHSDDETSRLVLVVCKYVKCANCETHSSVPYCKAHPKTRRNMFRFCGEKFRLLFGKALWQLDHSPMWLTDGAAHNNRYFLNQCTDLKVLGWQGFKFYRCQGLVVSIIYYIYYRVSGYLVTLLRTIWNILSSLSGKYWF